LLVFCFIAIGYGLVGAVCYHGQLLLLHYRKADLVLVRVRFLWGAVRVVAGSGYNYDCLWLAKF
jgi:hypothetical protein